MERELNLEPFIPHKILKVFKREIDRYLGDPLHSNEYYIEVCNVKDVNGQVTVLSGVPLTKSAMRRLVGTTSDYDIDSFTEEPLLDPGILRFNPLFHKRHILWYRPQMKHSIIFRKKTMTIWMPAMLFLVVFNNFYVFALKSNARPTMTTELFIAPIMNLSGADQLCWGSVDTANAIPEIDKEIAFWEDKLWNSMFPHVGHRCSKSEIMSVYNKVNKSGSKFPKKELIPLDMDLNDLLEKYLP